MLMDGNAMVHRAWHAIQNPLTLSTTNQDVRGVYGFLNAFLRALQEWNPTYCAIAFDLPGPTFRHRMYPAYKAHRPHTPDDLRAQFPLVRRVMEAFKVAIFEMDGYEADDVLGTLSKQASEDGVDTVIITGDTDTLQLVSENVVVALNRSIQDRIVYDVGAVRQRYGGLEPEQQPDIKALQGDASDNIKGVPGIGSKTAIKLIQDYGSIEGIYSNIGSVSPDRIKKLLVEYESDARQSLELTRIVTDAPINFSVEACTFWRYSREDVLALLRELEFATLVRRIPDINSYHAPSKSSPVMEEPVVDTDYRLIGDIQDLLNMIQDLTSAGAFAFDVETTSKDAISAELVGISFSAYPGKAYYLPLGHEQHTNIEFDKAIEIIKPVLQDPSLSKIAHNANYDMTVLANYGIHVVNLAFDTMVAAHLLGEKSVGLKNLAFSALNVEMTHIESLIGSGRYQKTMAQVPITDAFIYSCADADMTMRLKIQYEGKMAVLSPIKHVFDNLEMPLIPVLVQMQHNGVYVDVESLDQMAVVLGSRLLDIEKTIIGTIGHKFSLNSTQQLAGVLFDELGLPKTKKTKTGYSTDASVLESLRAMINDGYVDQVDHRAKLILDLILEYRELTKLKSTYVDSLPRLVNPLTGRVHTSYNQVGSATGRISSNDPNLQNIPVRTSLGRQVRRAFIAQESPDWILLSADYSQIELRVLAHLSGDEGLVHAFMTGQDVHSSTASQVYGVGLNEVTIEMRRIAKIMNFGVIYGLSAYGISQQTDLPRNEGARFIESYFAKYPGILDYLDITKTSAREQGYLETLSGRRRYIPEVNAANFQMRQAGERMAVNMPIQGTAADIVKLAMINVDSEMKNLRLRSKMILQVHDELIFEVPKEELEVMSSLLTDLMPQALKLSVPLTVEIKTGSTWGDLQ